MQEYLNQLSRELTTDAIEKSHITCTKVCEVVGEGASQGEVGNEGEGEAVQKSHITRVCSVAPG